MLLTVICIVLELRLLLDAAIHTGAAAIGEEAVVDPCPRQQCADGTGDSLCTPAPVHHETYGQSGTGVFESQRDGRSPRSTAAAARCLPL